MIVTPVDFATNIFQLNGQNLKMPPDSMRHLYPIYNKKTNASLYKFGRQTHKSTTLGYQNVLPCLKYPNYHSLYVAPTGQQVSVFSTDKLNGSLRESEIVREHYVDSHTKDQVSYKELRNGSKIYLRSAFHTADSIRGITADQTTFDEVQDLISDHISVIEQCMGHSMAKWEHMVEAIPTLPLHMFNRKIYAGTPKTVENTMEKYWKLSTQNEWIIKCQKCNKHNYINEENVGEECLICNKCHEPIFYQFGQWVSMNPGAKIDGYRMPQIVLNWINNPRAWNIQVIQPRAKYTVEKFYNEILALPYANARHPLNELELKTCCKDYDMVDENMIMNHPFLKSGLPTFAGIDWGRGDLSFGSSYSVLTISVHYMYKPRVIFMKKYKGRMSDALLQVEDMLRIINRFGCSLAIADFGDGRTSNALMVKALGPGRFGEVYEHGSQKKKVHWDSVKGIYVISRTQVMTDLFMEIKRDQIEFFRHDQFKEFQDDFLGIYSEYSDSTRMTKYDHSIPDDSFHSFMFSQIALKIKRGEYSKYLLGGISDDESGASGGVIDNGISQ